MAQAKFLSLLLVRAGPTEWDRQGRITGSVDLPLPPTSCSAVAEAGAPYGSGVAVVLSGPESAAQTAAKVFAPRARVRVVDELREPGLGLWEGLLETEVEQRYRACYREWRADPSSVSIPESEPMLAAQSRLVRAVVAQGARFASDAQHVAVIVRPIAWGLLRCWAENRALTDLWGLLEGAVGVQPWNGDSQGHADPSAALVTAVLVETTKLKELPPLPRTPTRARA
ncbi:MAG: histidine phosphatase family protein [Phycisphaerales bacterium]